MVKQIKRVMKELSIEQKAKRYDEAIKVAESNYETIVQMDNDCTFAKEGIVNTFHHIFPELKESNDERIRKWLIALIKSNEYGCISNVGEMPCPKRNVIDWLEKQGEHANFRNKIQIGDKVTRNQDGVLVNLSQLNRIAKKDEKQDEKDKFIEKELECIKGYREKAIKRLEELEKQGEHKLAEWSEEDEWCLEQINFLIRNSYSADDKVERLSNWVKSIKERVQPQPKQEWSEEDYNEIETIACHLDNINNEGMAEVLRSIRDKYMSLRPYWKPSDEQLDSLYDVLNPCDGFNREVLESLYVQLKKLREE